MRTRLELATHEAGHALVALALGLDVKLATILVDQHGRARIELTDRDAGTLEAQACVRLAGRQALVAFGELDPSNELGCRQDMEQARAYALVITEGDELEAHAVLKALRSRVDDLLLEHRLALGEISIALLKRWTLTGDELDQIAGGCRDRRWHLPQRAGLFPAIQAGRTIAAAGVLPPFGAGWRVQAPEPLAVDGERPGPSNQGVLA